MAARMPAVNLLFGWERMNGWGGLNTGRHARISFGQRPNVKAISPPLTGTRDVGVGAHRWEDHDSHARCRMEREIDHPKEIAS